MEQTTLFPEPRRPEQLELDIQVPEKSPEDLFLEDAVAFLDLQAQAAEARGAKKLAQKIFRTRQHLGRKQERN